MTESAITQLVLNCPHVYFMAFAILSCLEMRLGNSQLPRKSVHLAAYMFTWESCAKANLIV